MSNIVSASAPALPSATIIPLPMLRDATAFLAALDLRLQAAAFRILDREAL